MYFVPTGAVASFLSASLNVGASVVTSTPALPSASLYDGVRFSASVFVAVAVIVALSFVIAVPAGVDHTGSLYPSFAVTCGYLSAGNATPSFTSYTGGFVNSFTPSPATKVTLW